MPRFIDALIDRAKASKQTIVLPESEDARTLQAAQSILDDGVADLIILGCEDALRTSGYRLHGARIIDPATSDLLAEFAEAYFELRKHKGITREQAQAAVREPLTFGAMLVKTGRADGQVAGACHATADVLRPALQIIRTEPGTKLVSSFFIMEVPDCPYGENGLFLFSDCGLEVQPDSEKLAHIAVNSAQSFAQLSGFEPRVAMLSHSSMGSARNADASKVHEATALAKELAPNVMIDGELQLDAAIVPEIGATKAPDSPVAGKANVLIFPDLDAGNIGYKLVQRLAKAEALGPITQGLAAPVNDLSRGCSAQDIYGVVALTCVQSQERKANA